MVDLYLLRTAIRDLTRAKRIGIAALLVLAPAAIALAWRGAARGEFSPAPVYNTIESGLVFGFLMVILAAVFATGALAQEIEQKTIVYLLTRPVPRWRILLARFAAAYVMATAAVWLSTLLLAAVTYGGSAASQHVVLHDLAIAPVGTLCYGAFFLFLSTFLPRPLVFGLLYAFGWEAWVPMMPGDFQRASIMAYLRVLAPHTLPEAEATDLSSLLSTLSPSSISMARAEWTIAAVTAIGLLGALWLFSVREYVPREEGA